MKEAMGIARGRQRPGQTKEQTKIIARGIAEGITQYKKEFKARQRERNRNSKLTQTGPVPETAAKEGSTNQWLPWALLGASWIGFVTYLLILSD